MDSAIYSIGAVSRILGVSVGTLRSWEDRYALVVPERSEGGHRLYSREQIDRLQFVVARMDEGMAAGDAHRLLEQAVNSQADGDPVRSVDGLYRPSLVLVAERDPFAAEFAEFFLLTEGYEVQTVLDADRALEIAMDGSPRVIIVDLLISGGAGLALCEKLSATDDISVLAISTIESRDEALTAGAHAFLRKPIDPLRLVSTVKDLIGSSAYLRPRRG